MTKEMAEFITLHDLVKKKTWSEMWAERNNQMISRMERAFLFGNEFSEDEIEGLRAQGKPDFKINRIRPIIDTYAQIFKTSYGMSIIQSESHAIWVGT